MSAGLSFVPVESERITYPLPFATIEELIDRILGETPIGMRAAARMVGQHSASVQLQATIGLLRSDGSRLRLEAIKHGGRLLTSKQALKRFIAAQNEPAASTQDVPPRSPVARTRASEKAASELERMGC